jgi:glycosyltransferase involved in cell wall biosynthesis
VEFTGTVPDMRPYLGRATVVVVPLRIGSGTRLKILEAAAAGKPIVSTSLGAEGLEFDSKSEIVIADDPQKFTEAVVNLLRDHQWRMRIGRAARAKVSERYSQRTLTQAMQVVLSSFDSQKAKAASVCHGKAR